ncbi:unnamed protein product [Camellia sinensis]
MAASSNAGLVGAQVVPQMAVGHSNCKGKDNRDIEEAPEEGGTRNRGSNKGCSEHENAGKGTGHDMDAVEHGVGEAADEGGGAGAGGAEEVGARQVNSGVWKDNSERRGSGGGLE